MERKTKIALAVVIVALVIIIVVLVTLTKDKASNPAQNPEPSAQVTPTPEPTPTSSTDAETSTTPSPSAEPTEEASPTPTERVLTPEELLVQQLLTDPFGATGSEPVDSLTMKFHAEQEVNLDKNNCFSIDVSSRLKEQGVKYIPFTITLDYEREYTANGYRSLLSYDSTDGSNANGMAKVYDFANGTVRQYTYIKTQGAYRDDGKSSTKMTKEKYVALPEFHFDLMFSENALPELSETDSEYILKGLTTTSGYMPNTDSNLSTCTVYSSPAYGFQYLVEIELHYDKKTKRISGYDARVIGKVEWDGYSKEVDPYAKKTESELGIVSSVFHVEFTGYNATTLTRLDGKKFADTEKFEPEPVIECYAYTFADGSKRYFTMEEWRNAVNGYFSDSTDGLSALMSEINGIKNTYSGKIAILNELPEESRGELYKEDELWEAHVKEADESKERAERQLKEAAEHNMEPYVQMCSSAYYIRPGYDYLCSLLLDKDGNFIDTLSNEGYNGYAYSSLTQIAYNTIKNLAGMNYFSTSYNINASPGASLSQFIGMLPEDVEEKVWDATLSNLSQWYYENSDPQTGEMSPSRKHFELVIKIIRDDFRERFDDSFKAWLKKNKIGSETNPDK